MKRMTARHDTDIVFRIILIKTNQTLHKKKGSATRTSLNHNLNTTHPFNAIRRHPPLLLSSHKLVRSDDLQTRIINILLARSRRLRLTQ